MEKKAHDSDPILFSILHMCANLHHNRTNDKEFFFWRGTVPLTLNIFIELNNGIAISIRSAPQNVLTNLPCKIPFLIEAPQRVMQ